MPGDGLCLLYTGLPAGVREHRSCGFEQPVAAVCGGDCPVELRSPDVPLREMGGVPRPVSERFNVRPDSPCPRRQRPIRVQLARPGRTTAPDSVAVGRVRLGVDFRGTAPSGRPPGDPAGGRPSRRRGRTVGWMYGGDPEPWLSYRSGGLERPNESAASYEEPCDQDRSTASGGGSHTPPRPLFALGRGRSASPRQVIE